VWVFAHETNTHQVTHIQTGEGECTYTLTGLSPGDYLVVGWYYPGGASGAYTSLDTVIAASAGEVRACEGAITQITLAPGQHFEGADLGCWGGNFFILADPNSQIRLDPNRWQLATLEGESFLTRTNITLIFEDGKVYGSAGCNNYGGSYTSSPGGNFTLSEAELTAMLCTEPTGVMEQEQRYLQALLRARGYLTLDGQLHLQDEAGVDLLVFDLLPSDPQASPADLQGATWQLVTAPGLAGAHIAATTLRFEGQSFSGTSPCRDYAGTFQAEGDRLRIGILEMTSVEICGEPEMRAEGDFTTLLQNVESYHLAEGSLVLVTLQGQQLVFERTVP